MSARRSHTLQRLVITVGLTIAATPLSYASAAGDAGVARPSAPPGSAGSGDVYAYSRNTGGGSELVVMDGEAEITTVDLTGKGLGVTPELSWSDDGRYLSAIDDAFLTVVDVQEGTTHRQRCVAPGTTGCADAVTVWGDQVVDVDSADYYTRPGNQLMSSALPDLGDRRRLLTDSPQGVGWYGVQAAGDVLLAFGYNIEESGAHGALDVYTVDADGAATQVGDTLVGTTFDASAYANDTAYGGPLAAYAATGSGGACVGYTDVWLYDPAQPTRAVKTDTSAIFPPPPSGSDQYTSVMDLWFGGDGALYASATSHTCSAPDYSQSAVQTPLSVWRLDGTGWVEDDDRPLLSARDLPSGSRIELAAASGSEPTSATPGEGTLTVVDGNDSKTIADNVTTVSTPRAGASEAGAWLALGDSYSSGEGIEGTPETRSKYQPPRENEREAGEQRDCRRATGDGMEATAWAAGAYQQVKDALDLDEQTFVACTGALASESTTQIEEAKALSGRQTWDIVTFSFGGNDIGFGEVITGCTDIAEATTGGWKEKYPEGCDVDEDEMRARIDALVGTRDTAPGYEGTLSLPELYDEVAKVVEPGGDVIVAGYPNLLEEVDRWSLWRRSMSERCAFIDSYDVGMLRRLGAYLNEQIAAAVADAGERHRDDDIRFRFLDIANNPYELDDDPKNRHGLCSDDSWINGVEIDINSGGHAIYKDRSFHPKQAGHTATANVLAQFLLGEIGDEDLRRRLGDLEPSELPDDLKRELAVRYAPILKFHEDENSFPTSHERLLRNTELVRKVTKRLRRDQTETVKPMGEVTAGDLRTLPDGEYYLDIRDALKENTIEESDPELWYEFHDDVRAITYHLTYASNTGTNPHEGDTERVKVFFDDDWKPSRMVYSGHTSPTDVKEWNHVVVVRGRPCVFVAKGSHANYPWPGEYPSDGPLGRPQDDASEPGASMDLVTRPPADITTSPLWKVKAKVGNLGHAPGPLKGITSGVPAPGNQPALEQYKDITEEEQPIGMAEATARCAAGLPAATPPSPEPTPTPTTTPPTTSAPTTPSTGGVDSAVSRFEDFMHAFGNGDAAGACDVAGPYFEQTGGGPCDMLFQFAHGSTPDDQLASLRSATVDRSQVIEVSPERVEFPSSAIVTDGPLDRGELPHVMVYDQARGNWYLSEP